MNTASPWRSPASRPTDIAIEVKGNALTVSGKKAEKAETKTEFLHQGIASRAFERRFQLADHVAGHWCGMENGLLHISLKREIPEALKPRTIPGERRPGSQGHRGQEGGLISPVSWIE